MYNDVCALSAELMRGSSRLYGTAVRGVRVRWERAATAESTEERMRIRTRRYGYRFLLVLLLFCFLAPVCRYILHKIIQFQL